MGLLRVIAAVLAGAGALGALASCREPGAGGSGLARGAEAYLAHCALCHGDGGAGDGPLAAYLAGRGDAPPPDLARGTWLDGLGPAGVLAAMERGGAHAGRSGGMPVWGPHLGPEIAGRIADWVMTLPAPRPGTAEAVDRYFGADPPGLGEGRRTYVLYCSGCHGPRGRGDGPFSPALRRRLRPTDLTAPDAFAGLDDDALAARVGMGGAHAEHAPTMPGWLHTLEPERIWPLVRYLRSLPRARGAG
jgi:mono/diheme cytochrome c family protein